MNITISSGFMKNCPEREVIENWSVYNWILILFVILKYP
jgi:hypothetical protein